MYILLILFETHGHWQLYFIVTVSAKNFSCHPVHCKDTLSSVMVMKEILIMSGFKAITVLKLCLCPALSERRKKTRARGHRCRKNNRHAKKYLNMEYLPFPCALPAETKITHFTLRVVDGGLKRGENTAIFYAVCSMEAGVSSRQLASLLLCEALFGHFFPACTTLLHRIGKLEEGTLDWWRWQGLSGGTGQKR